MGYANIYPLSQLIFGSPQEPQFFIDASVHTCTFTNASITLPSWLKKERIKYAFYDFHVPYMANTSVLTNYVDGSQWFQVSIDGGVWRNANKIFDDAFNVQPSGTYTGYIVNIGNYDIAPYLATDATLTFRWVDSKALNDALWFINCWVTLRVIAE